MKNWAIGSVVFAIAMFSAVAENGSPGGLPMGSPEEAGMSTERLERLNGVMKGYVDRKELAGTVTLIARDGKIVHFEAHGERHVEANKPMERDTIFYIASMTKPITSVALMMLYEQGAFQLDDPISKWLPEYADKMVAIPAPSDERVAQPYKLVPADKPITVRHLLTHTAGLANTYRGITRPLLREASEGERPRTVEDSILRTADVPLNFHPGEQWEYGGATSMCGVLVEKMSGQTLDEFFRKNIFEPLGMHDTYFNIPKNKVERVAALYHPNEKDRIVLTRAPEYREPSQYFSGGGGLASTAADYFIFHQTVLNGGEYNGVRILGRKTIDLMITNHIGDLNVWLRGPGYGFGLGYAVLLDPGKAKEPLSPGTFGWGGAFNTYFWVDPVENMIGIFMSQIRPYTHLEVRTQFSVLAAQAIIDSHRDEPPPILGYGIKR